MKKSALVFLLSVWICVPSAFAGSKAVIHGSIEPIVIPEMLTLQWAPESSLQEASMQPIFDTNASKKDFFPQTWVEHIDGVTVTNFMVL